MVRLSPMSMTPVHPRIGVMAYGSPGSGERTSSEPKYVRWRGGHFSIEMFTSDATSNCVSTAHLTLEWIGMAGRPFSPVQELSVVDLKNDGGQSFADPQDAHALKRGDVLARDGGQHAIALEWLQRLSDFFRVFRRAHNPTDAALPE